MAFKLVESTTEPVLRKFYMTDSEGATVGQSLYFASGRLTTCVGAGEVAGIATHSVTAGTDQTCVIILVEPGQVWEVAYSGTPDVAFVVGKDTADIASGGLLLNAADVTGGAWAIVEKDTTNTKCKVICKNRQLS